MTDPIEISLSWDANFSNPRIKVTQDLARQIVALAGMDQRIDAIYDNLADRIRAELEHGKRIAALEEGQNVASCCIDEHNERIAALEPAIVQRPLPAATVSPTAPWTSAWADRAWAAYCADSKAATIDKGKSACAGSRWGHDTWEKLPQELKDEYLGKTAEQPAAQGDDAPPERDFPSRTESGAKLHTPQGDEAAVAIQKVIESVCYTAAARDMALAILAAIRRGEVPGANAKDQGAYK